jgi:hypothetical protein
MKKETYGPTIEEMKSKAEEQIKDGNDDGLLALYWINYFIKDKREKPVPCHPDNISWFFNNPMDLDHNWCHAHAWTALCNVWKECGGEM